MNIFHKIFFVFVTVLLAFLIPSMVKANDVSLGGMHLDGYCRSLGQGGVTLTGNTWTCESGPAINMNGACNWQYPNKNATASQTTQDNPYTWTCFEGHTQSTPTPTTSTPRPTVPATPTPTGGAILTPTPILRTTPTPLPTPTPTPSGQLTRLGGMDLDSYCLNRGLPRAVVNNGVWTCGQRGRAIDMNNACQWQYVPTAVSRQDVAGNPYTWSCYATNVTPTATPTPANPTPTQTVSSPTPTPTTSNIRVRRSIYSLSTDEVQRLVNAMNTLRNNGEYADFVNRHLQTMMVETPAGDPTTDRNIAHRGPAFLTWHRAFIYEYEERLRAVDPSVTLPYWPFESDSGSAPRVFSAAYFGSDGSRTQNDRVTDGPFASWNIIRRLGRDTESGQTRLPSTSEVNTLLQNTMYASPQYNEQSLGLVTEMEGWIGNNAPWGMHNRVHGYIGGDMITMDSVNDPIFFLLHANVDRLWWQWQQTRGITTFQPAGGGPVGHNLNDQLRFLLRVPTNADVLDIQNDMGYTYN